MATLGEITAIQGDAQIGAGTAGTAGNLAQLPTDYQGIQVLQTAALDKSRANQFALELMHKNAQNYMQNFNAMDVDGLMEEDYNIILPEYARLLGDIRANYDVISDPMRNREKAAELGQREAALRTRIAQSKQDKALRTIAGNFISQHKDFQTPENIENLRRFSSGGLNSADRNPDAILNLAPGYDMKQEEISKLANIAAEQKTVEQNTASPFMTKTERIEYRDKAYRDAVRSMINATDEYNRPILNGLSQRYQQAPEQLRQQYMRPDGTGNVEDFAIDQFYMPLRNQTDVSTTVDENKFALNDQDHKNRMAEIAAQAREQRRNFQFQKSFDDKEMETIAAELAIRQRNTFDVVDQPGAKRENIAIQAGTAQDNSALGAFSKWFGYSQKNPPKNVEGVPLNIDTWMMNAYSIPNGKTREYDDEGNVVEEDTYLRPENAWVTTEADPSARKVVVRYNTPTGTKDVVLPYAENFQALNNVAGEKNAVKLAAAKVKLMEKLTGKANPSHADLQKVPQFANPNTGGSNVGTTAPSNPTTGSFILNADQYLKNKNKK